LDPEDGNNIKRNLENVGVNAWIDPTGSVQGTLAGNCEYIDTLNFSKREDS